jgi:prenyl protein peptidase
MAPYSQQVVIATGRSDWKSRIEEDGQEESWGMLTRGVKRLISRGGKYADVSNGISRELIVSWRLTVSVL